jgi:hypothetical protein
VQRLLSSKAVQARLTVNQPDDQYEREADRVADVLTKTPDCLIQRDATKTEEKEELVQMKTAGSQVREVSPDLEARINTARGSGQPLPDSLRTSLEPRLQRDFGNVCIHIDAEADKLAQQLEAKAFTAGKDVFFREGAYEPDSERGSKLIVHEMAHVVQQQAVRLGLQRAPEKAAAGRTEVTTLGAPAPRGPGPIIPVRIVLSLIKRQGGLAIHRYDWSPAIQPPEGLDLNEKLRLQNTIREAKEQIESEHPEVLNAKLERDKVEFTFNLNLNELSDVLLQRFCARSIANEMMNAFRVARMEEQFGKPEAPEIIARDITVARERIQRVRQGMKKGRAEQAAAQSLTGKLSAFLCSVPPPAIEGWDGPENHLKDAERYTGDYPSVELSSMYIGLAERRLQSQEKYWSEYKGKYAFAEEVFAPVAWKAVQLFSMGLVDEELFEVSGAAAKEGLIAQLEAVVAHLVKRIWNIITLGSSTASYEAAEKWLSEHPDEGPWTSLAMSFVAGGKAGIESIVNTLLPIQEIETIADTDKTIGEKIEAFFSSLIKLISLGDMAKSEMAARKKAKLEPTKKETIREIKAKPNMNFEQTLAKGGWRKFIKSIGEDSPQAEALEAGRRQLAEELKQFDAERTGSQANSSNDFDVNFRGPNAEANILKAKDLLIKKKFPDKSWTEIESMLDLKFLSEAKRAHMYTDPRLTRAARRRIEAEVEKGVKQRYLERLKAEAPESPIAREELLKQAKKWGIDPKTIEAKGPMMEGEVKSLRARQDQLHAEFEAEAKFGKQFARDTYQAELSRQRMEAIAHEVVGNQLEINTRAPEFWGEPGAAYGEPTAVLRRVTGEALTAKRAVGDLLSQRREMFLKLAKLEKEARRLGIEDKSSVLAREFKDIGFSKYTMRTFELADQFIVGISSRGRPFRKWQVSRKVQKIMDAKAKGDFASIDKIFDEMTPRQRFETARDILEFSDETIRVMEKEVIPGKPRVVPYMIPKGEGKERKHD